MFIESIESHCAVCSAPFTGRIDRRYCSIRCKRHVEAVRKRGRTLLARRQRERLALRLALARGDRIDFTIHSRQLQRIAQELEHLGVKAADPSADAKIGEIRRQA